MPKKILVALLAVVLLLACPLTAGALSVNSVPYTTYDYNFYEESIASPAGYIPAKKITAETLGLDLEFSTPTDIYYDNNDSIYLLDSDNGRVIVLDKNFQLKTVLDSFLDNQGEKMTFAGAEGFTVGEDGKYYIADTQGERILVFNPDRTLLREIFAPEDEKELEEGLPFDVNKVMVDNRNNLYALSGSNNMGAFVFDKDGNYQRFFGGNKVVQTSEVVLKYLLRNFLTQEQLDGMVSSTPINLASFDVDREGFVYTSTVVPQTKKLPKGVIRKLNYLGKNILDEQIIFGDLEWDRQSTVSTSTNFVDLDVDEHGFINMLDSGRGKVFQYTERGELVAVFGSYGTQFGTFSTPQAVESIGDRVLVVDATKNCVYVFKPTSYGARYREAILKLQNDDFDGSLDVWQQLLAENSNNADAYYGIGRVYDMQGDYASAMKYYKLAGDRASYSEAFQEYRNILIEKMFLPAVGVIIALFVVLKIVKHFRRKKVKAVSNSAYSKLESKYTFPLYTLFHPMDGFQQLKPRKIGSWKVVWVLLVVLFAVFTLEYFATGYLFNLNRAVDYNLLIMLLKTIGIALLFIIANWAICTLFNGNGNLKEISCVTAYSLVPLIVAMLFKVVASNFLSMSEGAIMNIFLVLGILWTVLLLLCGLSCIHEYTMTQSVFSAIATVLGMAVIVFLIIMFFSLMQQTVSFVQSIITEIATR